MKTDRDISGGASLFSVGDRIAFDGSLASFVHDWDFGRITEVVARGSGHFYRIHWDDGFVDAPGTDAEWYPEDELVTEGKARAAE